MVALLKKLTFKLYVIALMAFTLWYGHFIYPIIFGFEGKEAAEVSLKEIGQAGSEDERIYINLIAENVKTKTTDLGYKTIEQPYIEGRFHHIGFEIEEDKASTCTGCHGNVPHSKSVEIRSFLNMHTYYLACETCHANPEEDNDFLYRWYDKETGQMVQNPVLITEIDTRYRSQKNESFYPVYGNYGTKIAPVTNQGSGDEFLHGNDEKQFITQYIVKRELLKPEEKSRMKKIIHRKVDDEPLLCDECHNNTSPHLDLVSLGYTKPRTKELESLAVIGMLKKYKQFYIPNLFDKH